MVSHARLGYSLDIEQLAEMEPHAVAYCHKTFVGAKVVLTNFPDLPSQFHGKKLPVLKVFISGAVNITGAQSKELEDEVFAWFKEKVAPKIRCDDLQNMDSAEYGRRNEKRATLRLQNYFETSEDSVEDGLDLF